MGISVNLVISLCVFLFCFQQGVGLAFLVVLVVFSFRWFVGSNGWSSANLFIRAFIPSGAVGRGFTRQPGGSKKCTTWHTPLPTPAASIEPCSILNAHTTSCLLHQRGKKELARNKLPYCKKEGRCFPLDPFKEGNTTPRVAARTRGRDLQVLGRFPPPLFQYLKPTCSYTSPSHYYHALQSWTPRHGTSTFTLPCLATTPPDMASYACLMYIPCLLLLIHIRLCAVDNCVYVNNNNTTRLVSCT